VDIRYLSYFIESLRSCHLSSASTDKPRCKE